MEYIERLAAEWYEYQGYFVRRDLWVGLEADGSYECELCIVAFHPTRRHLVHVEPAFDVLSWAARERHFRSKFDAGRKYLHRIFAGEPTVEIEQIALILGDVTAHPHSIAGGQLLSVRDFLTSILRHLARSEVSASMVPDQWPIIRTLQLVASTQPSKVATASTCA
jgi:hypothetical protein